MAEVLRAQDKVPIDQVKSRDHVETRLVQHRGRPNQDVDIGPVRQLEVVRPRLHLGDRRSLEVQVVDHDLDVGYRGVVELQPSPEAGEVLVQGDYACLRLNAEEAAKRVAAGMGLGRGAGHGHGLDQDDPALEGREMEQVPVAVH